MSIITIYAYTRLILPLVLASFVLHLQISPQAFASQVFLSNLTQPGSYNWTVPENVTIVQVKLWGGGGGGSGGGQGKDRQVAFAGGSGGFTSCILSVTPGQTLYVIVAGGGSSMGFGETSPGGFGGIHTINYTKEKNLQLKLLSRI